MRNFLCFMKKLPLMPTAAARVALFFVCALALSAVSAYADEKATPEMFTVNNLWILLAAILVFIMHLGFSCLESGLTRSKNTVNILFKNVSIIAIGILTYSACGFNLMYPGFAEGSSGFFGFAGFGISSPEGAGGLIAYADGAYTYYADFIFQAMFAATAATIVSGAVAERIKLGSFLIFATVYVAFVYPVAGSWKWGGGWLDALGFYDFAGSTIVHSVGGWAALVGAILLGSRKGRYSADGKVRVLPGHSLPLATIGIFLLWFGWYGFNGGSVLSADPGLVSLVFVTTSLAAAAGIVGAMGTAWIINKNPDLSMILNGSLAGLVGITAGADVISPGNSVIVGLIAGVIVVISVRFMDRMLIDDPVGAISVHLTCGIWGTLAVGIFSSGAEHTFMAQLIGVLAYGVFCAVCAFVIFYGIKIMFGLRVSEEEEYIGLDVGEHGMEAYNITKYGSQ